MSENNHDQGALEFDDYVNMSDEDFDKLNEAPGEDSSDTAVEDTQEEETDLPDNDNADIEEDPEKDSPESSEENDDDSEDSSSEDSAGEGADEDTNNQTDIDYKAVYEKVMAPFKANGVELQVKDVDDVIQLMKMGAGFHKRMSALKPVRKTVKLLEQHDLLEPEKINFLIDLHNKNPEAITKLLRDSNIDPLEINLDAESDYTPTHRAVSDIELNLDTVLDEIKDTPSYGRTLNVVTSEWDETSQKAIASAPHIIATINRHIADGTFDKVMGAVNYERSLGRLTDLNDFEAYKRAGDMLYQQGQLSIPGQPNPSSKSQSVQQPNLDAQKKEADREKRKKAAMPNKSVKTPANSNVTLAALADLSDEDFEKINLKDLQRVS